MPDAPAICPHCGYDLRLDEPIDAGDFVYLPRNGLYFGALRVPLSPQQLELAAAVIRARGRTLPYEALAARLGSEAANVTNLAGVQMFRMRKAFAAVGAPMPIERVWGQGLRWNRDA